MRKYFGTDGIRGRVGDFPITPDFFQKLGWAIGRVLGSKDCGENKVLVGKDTRISGYMFESALEAGISSAGVNVHLLGPLPTPAIAFLTRFSNARAGVVISASHNSFQDNGLKFFGYDGNKLSDDVELEIEEEIEKQQVVVEPRLLGKASRVKHAQEAYIDFCKKSMSSGISVSGLKIVVDCANGAAYQVAPKLLSELGCQVFPIGVSPDGVNINDGVGATSPELLQREVLARKADLGIALDGDADRLIMVDETGAVVDGDELLFIIARYRQHIGGLQGTVIGTEMSNLGLERAITSLGLGFERSKVGDRYVLEKLREGGWSLGGEQSGHIICRDLTTTGDGLISGLQVLEAVISSGDSLSVLKAGMTKLPQRLLNIPINRSIDVERSPKLKAEIERITLRLGQNGRVLLRKSGTEPLIRVMIEGEDLSLVEMLCLELAEEVRLVTV
ncbi:MAG: phosphoglucosamine mutase [Proteobacteria bacterium]|nr:phosphoglucosamine mutase [Pseudomonadota bacterium]